MYRQLLHTADISPFDIIILFFWRAQWARSIISAVLFLFHWVHTLTMVTFLNGSTCALPILYNNLQPILNECYDKLVRHYVRYRDDIGTLTFIASLLSNTALGGLRA